MARRPTAKPQPAPAPEPEAPKVPFLKWPEKIEELPETPRTFRIHRVGPFEWQAFVTDATGEKPIGKPDLFELVEFKVKHVIRNEGQREFLAAKKAKSEAQERLHQEKAAEDAKQA